MHKNNFLRIVIVLVVATGVLLFVHISGDKPNQQKVASTSSAALAEQRPASEAVNGLSTTNPKTLVPETSGHAAAPVQSETSAEFETRLDAMQQRRDGRTFDAAEVAAAVQRPSAWQPAEEVPGDLPLEPEEFTDGRQFIQLDSLKIETLMPGDTLKVAIDESGQEYAVAIDRVEKNDYDSISWFGHIDADDGQTYSVSFTRGTSLTVGGLDTPDGHYVLQAQGDEGWIASSNLLFKVDPAVSDVVYPEDVLEAEASPVKQP